MHVLPLIGLSNFIAIMDRNIGSLDVIVCITPLYLQVHYAALIEAKVIRGDTNHGKEEVMA